MMKKNPIFAVILIFSLIFSLMGAALAESETDVSAETDVTLPLEENSLMGQVSAMDENTITLNLIAVPELEESVDTDTAEAAEAENSTLTLTGKTMTFTYDGQTDILLASADGGENTIATAENITVGSIVTVTLSNNFALSIVVEQPATVEAAPEITAEAQEEEFTD